ncbi:MAG: ABC transporter ATP-binding protein [Candidatus Kariarchaeaceae archaeon]|jgi:putative ABC transport system ATP-binding protein
MEPVITVKDIYKIYQSGTVEKRIETVALRGVSVDINENDFITVMGPSGSGKTTLLNSLAGLDTPSAGNIIYRNEQYSTDITKLTGAQLDRWRHDKVGLIFQNVSNLHHLTALENVQLPLKFLGIENGSRARDLLIRLGLEKRLNHKMFQLSAGERQRVALASAIVFNPLIVVADEPTGELDSQTLTQTMDLFVELHEEENIIFFLVTHNPNVAKYGNRYFTLEDGILTEREKAFSYDDFASTLGAYVVHIDRINRLMMPHDLIRQLNPSEGLVNMHLTSSDPPELVISIDIQQKNTNSVIAQIDQNNKILLPSKFWNLFQDRLVATFDPEVENQVILRRSQNE